jgi:hypothetical protein
LQGQPRGVVPIPVERTPLISPDAAGAVGTAIARLGGSLQHAGGSLLEAQAIQVRGQELEAQRRKAQDVLDGETAIQDYKPALDKWYDALRREGNPSTLPEDLEARGKDLIFQHGEPLTPGARQRFEAQANAYVGILTGKARDARFEAQEAQKQVLTLHSIRHYTQAMTEATDPAERQFYRTQAEQLLTDGTIVNLITPGEADKFLQALDINVRREDLRRDIRLDPLGKLEELLHASAAGMTTLAGRPMAEWIDETRTEAREQFTDAQTHDLVQRRERDLRSANRRVGLLELSIQHADNAGILRELQTLGRTDRQNGILVSSDAEAVQQTLYERLRSLEADTHQARNTTDPAMLQEYFALLLDNPPAAREFVAAHAGQGISVSAAPGFFASAGQATDERHWRNLAETKDAIAFVQGELSTSGNPIIDLFESTTISSVRAQAINDLLLGTQTLAGRDGLGAEAVREGLPALRDEIVRSAKSRLQTSLDQKGSQLGVPQVPTITDAARRWHTMVSQGISLHEANRWLGLELIRHGTARPEGMTSAEKAAADNVELQQALRALPPLQPARPPRQTTPPTSQLLPAEIETEIDTVATTHHVDPALVRAVIQVESSGNPHAVSPAPDRAKGLMQLMDATAAAYGVTDPFDTRQNLQGGIRYLADLQRKYPGRLDVQLAAYNAGEPAVDRYGGIPPYPETQAYVQKVLALYQGQQGEDPQPEGPR